MPPANYFLNKLKKNEKANWNGMRDGGVKIKIKWWESWNDTSFSHLKITEENKNYNMNYSSYFVSNLRSAKMWITHNFLRFCDKGMEHQWHWVIFITYKNSTLVNPKSWLRIFYNADDGFENVKLHCILPSSLWCIHGRFFFGNAIRIYCLKSDQELLDQYLTCLTKGEKMMEWKGMLLHFWK